MQKPKNCPKCGALWDEINNTQDMGDAFGLSTDGVKQWMCSKCGHFFNDNEATLEAWYDNADFSKMTLSQLSDVILSNWRNISPHAFPYADAMRDLEDMDSTYGADSAEGIIVYFLGNAKEWKTETAKKVKKELKRRLKDYENRHQ